MMDKAFIRAASILDKFYNDELVITRDLIIENDDGSIDIVEDEILEKKYKCRISETRLDNSKVENINKYAVEYKVFCDLTVDIKQGDTITVNKIINDSINDTIKGVAGKPYRTGISQEIIIIQEGYANE